MLRIIFERISGTIRLFTTAKAIFAIASFQQKLSLNLEDSMQIFGLIPTTCIFKATVYNLERLHWEHIQKCQRLHYDRDTEPNVRHRLAGTSIRPIKVTCAEEPRWKYSILCNQFSRYQLDTQQPNKNLSVMSSLLQPLAEWKYTWIYW